MNNWKTTNYHGHVQSTDKIELTNGCWYEIGFQNALSKNFVHQGIVEYNNGFHSGDSYRITPFPTHARKIELTIPEGQFTL